MGTHIPGQSNDPNQGRRTMENSLIRELVMRSRLKGMGLPSGNDKRISALKRRLYG